MKSPIIVLPILIQTALVAALYFAATSAATQSLSPSDASADIPATEIHRLHEQRALIEARLIDLEAHSRVFLPRGMGNIASTESPQLTQKMH